MKVVEIIRFETPGKQWRQALAAMRAEFEELEKAAAS